MMALLHRGLLYAGMIVTQITPTPTPPAITGEEVTNVIDAINNTANTFQDFTTGLAALFVFAIFGLAMIAYFYFNRNASKGAQELMTTFAGAMGGTLKEREERIDKLEAQEVKREELQNEGMMAVGDGLNRIADLWTAQQKREVDSDRILSDAVSVMTAIATVGSKPLQKVVEDVGALQGTSLEINKVVGQVYEILLINFPLGETLEERFETLKQDMIVAVERACEKAKHDTSEVATVTLPTQIEVTMKPAADSGEVAA